ncbi:hypothetical protein D915_007354 [Fasciola hepatica]|uniref:Uncharacterized protein n=1 Tax=Fasciola hepatica TaxID=6192 RepID=A0A4E0R3E4_FASHE|nr:hypothetical protein D915_007354 [Fasciola hepatica]
MIEGQGFASLLQQYKLEVNKAEYLTTDNLKKDVCNASSLDEMLNYLLDSTQHYMKKCMEDEKKWSDTRGMTNINLKMLNLLGRVAAFCVREFSTTALSKKSTTTNGLKQWLFWMTKMRHCGGLCASGTGKNQTLAKSLESSAFLAIDVVLNHLLSHPVLNGKECSVAADLIRYQNHDPEIYCRIYGTVMSSLSRQPQYFDRWFNDEFNLFQEFFSACAQVHFPPETCSDLDCENERLNAMAGEFYATLLSQACACICALPANCFNYLESSLLSGLLSEHLWTSLLATDMWCFLARYGTGNLCWQYATTLAEALHRSALELIQSWKPSRSGSVCSSLLSLDRLGRLLARLIVFLTPKHQTKFLCNFRLSCVDPKANGSTRCLLWWFVPLQVGRLQKSAQTMVRDQLSDRLCHLSGRMARSSPESESQSDLFAVIDTAVTLHLVDSMPSCWRESNVAAISQLAIQLVTKPRVHSQSDGELPCASWLSRTILRPKSALIGRLCIWNPHLTVSGLHCSPENPSAHLLQVITSLCTVGHYFPGLVRSCFPPTGMVLAAF